MTLFRGETYLTKQIICLMALHWTNINNFKYRIRDRNGEYQTQELRKNIELYGCREI